MMRTWRRRRNNDEARLTGTGHLRSGSRRRRNEGSTNDEGERFCDLSSFVGHRVASSSSQLETSNNPSIMRQRRSASVMLRIAASVSLLGGPNRRRPSWMRSSCLALCMPSFMPCTPCVCPCAPCGDGNDINPAMHKSIRLNCPQTRDRCKMLDVERCQQLILPDCGMANKRIQDTHAVAEVIGRKIVVGAVAVGHPGPIHQEPCDSACTRCCSARFGHPCRSSIATNPGRATSVLPNPLNQATAGGWLRNTSIITSLSRSTGGPQRCWAFSRNWRTNSRLSGMSARSAHKPTTSEFARSAAVTMGRSALSPCLVAPERDNEFQDIAPFLHRHLMQGVHDVIFGHGCHVSQLLGQFDYTTKQRQKSIAQGRTDGPLRCFVG